MAGPIDENIELAAAIGRVTGAWSLIESQLTVLFCALSGLSLVIGAAIFDFFKSTSMQSQVLTRLGKVSPRSNDRVRLLLKDALDQYAVLASERNQLAHNPFGWSSPEKSEIYIMIKQKNAPDDFPWTTKPLVLADINKLREEIDIFQFKLLLILNTIKPLPKTPS